MNVEQFIEASINGGYGVFVGERVGVIRVPMFTNIPDYKKHLKENFSEMVLDPEAWRSYLRYHKFPEGLEGEFMFGMVNALLKGLTLEEYIESL